VRRRWRHCVLHHSSGKMARVTHHHRIAESPCPRIQSTGATAIDAAVAIVVPRRDRPTTVVRVAAPRHAIAHVAAAGNRQVACPTSMARITAIEEEIVRDLRLGRTAKAVLQAQDNSGVGPMLPTAVEAVRTMAKMRCHRRMAPRVSRKLRSRLMVRRRSLRRRLCRANSLGSSPCSRSHLRLSRPAPFLEVCRRLPRPTTVDRSRLLRPT
jgi:hypothetical protein